ncbi:hypothetical protein GGR55DRAFT_634715 [Xylaria sp. FL0064]|nr:hypothetical protein GGR55DRAFT_634715 [Xylaria sp. FL0064]
MVAPPAPGRFFASLEIKYILVHFLMTYDFKLVNGQRPANLRHTNSSSLIQVRFWLS